MSVFGNLAWELTKVDTLESFDVVGRVCEYMQHDLTSKEISRANAKLSRSILYNEKSRFIGEYRVFNITVDEYLLLRSATKIRFKPYKDNSLTFEATMNFTPFRHNNLDFFDSGIINVQSTKLLDKARTISEFIGYEFDDDTDTFIGNEFENGTDDFVGNEFKD